MASSLLFVFCFVFVFVKKKKDEEVFLSNLNSPKLLGTIVIFILAGK